MELNNNELFEPILAFSDVKGSNYYPSVNGRVIFKKKGNGVLVTAEIMGLPSDNKKCSENIFALHIHEGKLCAGNFDDPFVDAGQHFNPDKCRHPEHVGDLPPLFGNNGYAYMSVYTERFTISEIIGKTLIIHSKTDDFKSQPSGNSGEKIACGEIIIL